MTIKKNFYFFNLYIYFILGPYLIVITKKSIVGNIYGQSLWRIENTDIIPYARTMIHLTEEQVSYAHTFSLLESYYFFKQLKPLHRDLIFAKKNITVSFLTCIVALIYYVFKKKDEILL